MCGQKHIFPIFTPYFGSLVTKAVAIVEISLFAYFILCLCIFTFKLFIWFGPVVLKPMAIIEISSFSLASYVALGVMYIQIQKPMLFHHWFGLLAVKAGEIIKISIISHLFPAV